MKTNARFKLSFASFFCALFFLRIAGAATVTVYDSVVSLATNVTKNYTFTDSSSGETVVVAVTMTPYSSLGAHPQFSLLDNYGPDNTAVHVGVDSGLGSGDGNLIVYGEGVDFSATLVSASSGVTTGSIQFSISGLGLRAVDGNSPLSWSSSATSANAFVITNESVYALDTNLFSLNSGNYSGALQFAYNDGSDFQLSDAGANSSQSVVLTVSFTTTTTAADPRISCWFTADAGKYARVYTNDAMKSAGNTLTNWSVGSLAQTNPAYCGIQEVYSSTNWIYVRSTGMASYIMGPWYLNSGRTMMFPNLPTNQKLLYRFPRTNGVPATKSLTGGGQIGIFVDGVEMFNSWDAYTWSTVSNVDAQNINGYWHRDAYINEGVTFDAGNAHQQNSGTYHYHANPIALRYLLGDHVDYDAATKTYYEDTNPPTKHSPILAWTSDGYPVYGPYGYSNATNANSGIRRMVSGYVLRNGQDGTENLSNVGRIHLPQWAVRIFNVSSNQTGAPFDSGHQLDCYMEDNDYLGDCINSATGTNYQQGVDFDLDEYNGRWCVTPEFPGGTYAYFVAITSNGAPQFPYNIGRAFRGTPVGGTVAAISETVVTNFLGNTNLASEINSPMVNNGKITLSWSAIEGGSYQVEATTNLSDSSGWTVVQSGIKSPPNQVAASYTNSTSLDKQFYRVGRTSVATFDSAGTTIFATNGVAPGGTAYRGQSVLLTITLTAPPPLPNSPPPISSVTVGGITASYAASIATNQVQALISIPSNYTPTGSQTVVVTIPPPPGQMQPIIYTLNNGFTIN
jgi:hypothetical protein